MIPNMSNLSPLQRRLDRALDDLSEHGEPMTLSELDGYLAGIIVCPDTIMPSTWLPMVWGEGDNAAVFENMSQAKAVTGMVMEYYNTIAKDIARGPDHYSPVYDMIVDPPGSSGEPELFWQLWMSGFERAMQLSPDSWDRIGHSQDDDGLYALSAILLLAMIANAEPTLATEHITDIQAMTADAPDMIPDMVCGLNAWRAHHSVRGNITPVSSAKIGRNHHCPCGSGKKYKKCCADGTTHASAEVHNILNYRRSSLH